MDGYFKCLACGKENVFWKKNFLTNWDMKTFICSFCNAERQIQEKWEQGELFKNDTKE